MTDEEKLLNDLKCTYVKMRRRNVRILHRTVRSALSFSVDPSASVMPRPSSPVVCQAHQVPGPVARRDAVARLLLRHVQDDHRIFRAMRTRRPRQTRLAAGARAEGHRVDQDALRDLHRREDGRIPRGELSPVGGYRDAPAAGQSLRTYRHDLHSHRVSQVGF